MANFERMASPRLFNVLLSLIAPVAMSNLPLILPGGSPSLSKCSNGHVETPSSSLFSLVFFPGMRKSSLPARTNTQPFLYSFNSGVHNTMSCPWRSLPKEVLQERRFGVHTSGRFTLEVGPQLCLGRPFFIRAALGLGMYWLLAWCSSSLLKYWMVLFNPSSNGTWPNKQNTPLICIARTSHRMNYETLRFMFWALQSQIGKMMNHSLPLLCNTVLPNDETQCRPCSHLWWPVSNHQWRLVVFKVRKDCALVAWLPLACLHCWCMVA